MTPGTVGLDWELVCAWQRCRRRLRVAPGRPARCPPDAPARSGRLARRPTRPVGGPATGRQSALHRAEPARPVSSRQPCRCRIVPRPECVGTKRFSSRRSSALSAAPGLRSWAATTTEARSPSGSGRSAATPASTMSPAAPIRRASRVRDQSGRNHCEIRFASDGFSDFRESPTPQR